MQNNDEYKTDHVEEIINQVGTPSDKKDIDYDDTFLEIEDKKRLIECILTEIRNSPNYSWADEVMVNCVAMYKYKQTVNNINVADYLKEKKQLQDDPLQILK
tara:strand:- start:1278 stop:1583 length:306 start_codon:yes stop_codon:yes gene_type:complete